MTRDVAADVPVPIIVTVKGDPAITAPLERVELDLSKFHSGRWAMQLDALAERSEPVVILAQGVACLAVAWWSQLSPRSYMDKVRGAVFLSPLALGFGQAGIARNVRESPVTRLPFPSIVAADPSPIIERVLALADGWGSRFVDAAARLGTLPGGDPVHERLAELLRTFGREAFAGAVPAAPMPQLALVR